MYRGNTDSFHARTRRHPACAMMAEMLSRPIDRLSKKSSMEVAYCDIWPDSPCCFISSSQCFTVHFTQKWYHIKAEISYISYVTYMEVTLIVSLLEWGIDGWQAPLSEHVGTPNTSRQRPGVHKSLYFHVFILWRCDHIWKLLLFNSWNFQPRTRPASIRHSLWRFQSYAPCSERARWSASQPLVHEQTWAMLTHRLSPHSSMKTINIFSIHVMYEM